MRRASPSKNAQQAYHGLNAYWPEGGGHATRERIEGMFRDLMHLCDVHDLYVPEIIGDAIDGWCDERDAYGVATCDVNGAQSDRYTGWDRIHDDNKAEGRPIGNQWDSRGVDYSAGYKVRRP